MASPQCENGYTKIANELLDVMVTLNLPPNQWRVLLFIIRKTYGFGKKVDRIANFQIANGTGLDHTVVSRSLRALVARGLITKEKRLMGLVKDWERWKLTELPTFEKSEKLTELSTKVDRIVKKSWQNCQTQKKKENIQKKMDKGLTIETVFPGSGETISADVFWSMAKQGLNGRMSAANFESWIEQVSPVGFGNGVFVVRCSGYTAETVGKRLRPVIEKTMGELWGTPLTLRCEVDNG